jgi:hypothetical protein
VPDRRPAVAAKVLLRGLAAGWPNFERHREHKDDESAANAGRSSLGLNIMTRKGSENPCIQALASCAVKDSATLKQRRLVKEDREFLGDAVAATCALSSPMANHGR